MNEEPRYIFLIDDEFHSDTVGDSYTSFDDAMCALRKILSMSFNEVPHRPPCENWKDCQRDWFINKYLVVTHSEWQHIEQTHVAKSTFQGVDWKS